jgi:hypothetical protein
MPLTAPTWIAAIATAVLAVSLIVAIWLARSALGARSGQLAAQRELTAELTEVMAAFSKHLRQAADERRRAQACQVFIELDRATASSEQWHVCAAVHNTSQQPVYDLYVIWLLGTTRMGKPDRAARLLPGQQLSFERGPELDANDKPIDPGALAAFLTFRDTAGVRWTVREDGTLSDISPAPD